MDDATLIQALAVVLVIVVFAWRWTQRSAPKKDWVKPYLNFKSLHTAKFGAPKTGLRYLVTGGHGCLGSHLVEALLARGETDVTVFDWTPSTLFEGESRVRFVRGDIRDAAAVSEAMKGIDVVFHMAAMMNYWSNREYDYQPSYEINVRGTENVIEACVQHGIKHLVYTSSIAVITGSEQIDLENVPEDVPYPTAPYFSNYARTKALAEQLVLSANGRNGLKTGALRIDGAVWGPRDIVILYYFVEELTSGKPSPHTAVCAKTAKAGYGFAPNLAHGHLCLEKTLRDSSVADGQVYNLQDQVVTLGPFYEKMCAKFGVGCQWVPIPVVRMLAFVMETLQWFARGRLNGALAKISRSAIRYMIYSCWLNGDKARRELGYKPIYTLDEALQISADFRAAFGKAWASGSL